MPRPQSQRNVAMPVVMKRVGSKKTRAKPTQRTMKTTAARRARIRAARTAKTAMEMVITAKRPRGRPERAMCDAMKDWDGGGEG